MKETIIILLVLVFYLLVSYFIYRLLLTTRAFSFVFICIAYLIFTYYLFVFFIYVHSVFRSRGIYLNFGHADIELLEALAVCMLIALTNVIVAIVVKYKKRKV
jgi:hypothetical protein